MKSLSRLFKAPEKLELRDVVFAAVSIIAIVLFCPVWVFEGIRMDRMMVAVLILLTPVSGWVSAALFYKRYPEKVDPFYIRAWWGLISGLVAFPVCLIFRRVALDVSMLLVIVGAGEIVGHFLYRRLRG